MEAMKKLFSRIFLSANHQPVVPEDEMDIKLIEVNGPDRLSAQPSVVLENIGAFLNIKDRARLAGQSRGLNELFKPMVEKERGQQFLQAVAWGQLNEAQTILRQTSVVGLYYGEVTDYSSRRLYGTGLRIALGAEDPEMVEMIQDGLLDHLGRPDGLAEIQRQQAEQFPDEEKEWEMRQSQDRQALECIIQAIGVATVTADDHHSNLAVDEPCQAALRAFRAHCDPKASDVISTGRHFNAQFLLDAFELYNRHYDDFGGHWASPKNMLFWRQVIGYIQRSCPANVAQAFCHGIYDIVESGEKCCRSFKFCHGGASYFPLSVDSGLGFDVAAATHRAAPLPHHIGLAGPFANAGMVARLQFMSDKNSSIAELMQRPGRKSQSACLIL